MNVVNDMFLSLIEGTISVLALLDFSSTFDTINHSILVHRTNTDFGFNDSVLQWFSSYLTDLTQYVSSSNHCSAFAPVHSGVAQFKVFGPIHFSMCTSVCLPITTHTIMHHSFADDLQMQMCAPQTKYLSQITL